MVFFGRLVMGKGLAEIGGDLALLTSPLAYSAS